MRDYGAISLTVTSPPQSFTEPLTAADAVAYLNLPENLNENLLLEGFIAAAREVAEIFQNRDLVQKQYDLALDYFPGEIELPGPLVSVDLVQYRDSDGAYTTVAADTGYLVDTARSLLMPAYGELWPSFTGWPSSAVLVRFTSGLAAGSPFWLNEGHRILIGMKLLISHWYTGRLPFEPSNMEIQEYPFAVTALLSLGAIPRVR